MQDIKKLLGKRIKELRTRQNLSQQKLAEMVNIDQRSISHIERGCSFPSKSLDKIAIALGVDISDLFNFKHLSISQNEMVEYIEKTVKNLEFADVKTIYHLIKSMK